MLSLTSQIEAAVQSIRRRWNGRPRVGMILGTGLGGFADEIERQLVVGYDEIPHFARCTAPGHGGRLVCGQAAGVSLVAMDGRLHRYEGYSLQQITLPVRVMRALGIELLIVASASGGLNPAFASGDLLVIEDHINLLGDNPLVGIDDDGTGPHWRAMSQPYDRELVERALQIARRENIMAHRGVYVAVCGPNYETRAEYRFLRTIGADAVGMSTVPEVIVAVHAGLRVLALSAITNLGLSDAPSPIDAQHVIEAACAAEPKVRKIVLGILADVELRGELEKLSRG
jgi:purine-nucleoside phosphorylase